LTYFWDENKVMLTPKKKSTYKTLISKFKTVCLHFIINLCVVVVEKAPVMFHRGFFYVNDREKTKLKMNICQICFSIVDLSN